MARSPGCGFGPSTGRSTLGERSTLGLRRLALLTADRVRHAGGEQRARVVDGAAQRLVAPRGAGRAAERSALEAHAHLALDLAHPEARVDDEGDRRHEHDDGGDGVAPRTAALRYGGHAVVFPACARGRQMRLHAAARRGYKGAMTAGDIFWVFFIFSVLP